MIRCQYPTCEEYSNKLIDAFVPSMGEVWAEVTVPYSDITLVNGPSSIHR
jgi:hypothetical protein